MYYATTKEIEKLDKMAVNNGLEIRQMMELAGWHILALMERLRIQRKKILIICGKGNKGGDALAAARHLVNYGWKVTVILLSFHISNDSRHHLNLLKKMNVKLVIYKNETQIKKYIKQCNIIIDGLIGYHLNGPPRRNFKTMINLMNNSGKKIISYDIPSGIDATTGKCFEPCIKAYATITLALPKRAILNAKKYFGKTFLADIGIPKFLYDKIRIKTRPFVKNNSGIIKL